MHGVNAVDGDRSQAGEAPWAVEVVGAGAAAEGPPIAVGDADILGAAAGLAALSGETRLAEIGVVGHADVDDIGVAGPHLLAAPALWTLVNAALGADAFAHVLDAPAGLALAVLGALVKKAAFAGFAVRGEEVWPEIRWWHIDSGLVWRTGICDGFPWYRVGKDGPTVSLRVVCAARRIGIRR